MSDDIIQPASIPEVILKQKQAINLYLIAVIALAVIGVLSIVGAMILAAWGKAVPGEVWTVVGIAVGALSVMLGGERQST
jgi:hypothetical protein